MEVMNLSLGEMAKGSVVPGATYRLRIHKMQLNHPKEGATNDKGEEKVSYVNVDFVVQDEGEFFGRHVFQNFTLKPGANFGLRKLLEAIGIPEDAPVIVDGKLVVQCDDAEVNAVVVVKPEGKGADGKMYDEQNDIKKFIPVW